MEVSKKEIIKFQKTVWDFYKKNKREFPWRKTKNPYFILVSEIMLQQTQADRVVSYYEKWTAEFPDFLALANAKFETVFKLWQGLGYNRRAIFLKKTAEAVVKEYKGKLPKDLEALKALPGIGNYTAAAVCIFAYNEPLICIETNIRRVFIHFFFADKENISDAEILEIIKKCGDKKNSREWHWALMDYGAYLKKTVVNPNRRHAQYQVQSKFEGSARQARGIMLKNLAVEKMNLRQLAKKSGRKTKQTKEMLARLTAEGFLDYNEKDGLFSLR